MRIFKYIIPVLAILTAGLSLSCRKDESVKTATEDGTVTVDFLIETGQTKASGLDEAVVSRAEIYVFNHSTGSKVAWNNATGSSLLSIQVTGITRNTSMDIYAICNKATDGSLSSAQVRNLTSTLSDNASSSFVMGGSITDVTYRGDASSIIEVTRTAAKITIGSIENNLQETDLKSAVFTVKRIYLINAVTGGYKVVNQTGTPASWGNVCYNTGSAPTALLSETLETPIAAGSEVAFNRSFYCYPNPTPQKEDKYGQGKSVPMRTRLVVEADALGETFYYPITIDGIQPNTRYYIPKLTVTRKGASDPNGTVETNIVSFNMIVEPWRRYPFPKLDL